MLAPVVAAASNILKAVPFHFSLRASLSSSSWLSVASSTGLGASLPGVGGPDWPVKKRIPGRPWIPTRPARWTCAWNLCETGDCFLTISDRVRAMTSDDLVNTLLNTGRSNIARLDCVRPPSCHVRAQLIRKEGKRNERQCAQGVGTVVMLRSSVDMATRAVSSKQVKTGQCGPRAAATKAGKRRIMNGVVHSLLWK